MKNVELEAIRAELKKLSARVTALEKLAQPDRAAEASIPKAARKSASELVEDFDKRAIALIAGPQNIQVHGKCSPY